MGKRVAAKTKNPRKSPRRPEGAAAAGKASAGAALAEEEVSVESSQPDLAGEGGDAEVASAEAAQCVHYVQASDGVKETLRAVSTKRRGGGGCEHCREDSGGRRVGSGGGKGGKARNPKKKKKAGAGGGGDEDTDEGNLWICLECGREFCAGVGVSNGAKPYGHARRHSKQDRHPLAVRSNAPTEGWCFMCDIKVMIELPAPLKADLVIPPPNGKEATPTASESSISSYAIRGLANLGNTCFFNSVLQNILTVDMMRKGMASMDRPVTGPMTMALRKIFEETSSGDAGAARGATLSPKGLFGSLCAKAPQFRGYQQQDSHELLRYLLDGLHMEEVAARRLKAPSNEQDNGCDLKPIVTMVEAIFCGQLSSTVSCMECGHTSVVYEPFLDLSLPVPSKKPPPKAAVPSPPKRAKPPLREKNKGKKLRDQPPEPKSSSRDNSAANPSEVEEVISSKAECNSEQGESCTSVSNGAAAKVKDDSFWLNYLGPTDEDEVTSSVVESGDHPVCNAPVAAIMDDSQAESAGKDEDVPVKAEHSGVISLPYKSEDCTSQSENLSSVNGPVVSAQEPVESMDGLGDLFNESEVSSGPNKEIADSDVMRWNISSPVCSHDEIDDSNNLVSVASCLALFTKPELLTGEHAWHCVKCAAALSRLAPKENEGQSMNATDKQMDLDGKTPDVGGSDGYLEAQPVLPLQTGTLSLKDVNSIDGSPSNDDGMLGGSEGRLPNSCSVDDGKDNRDSSTETHTVENGDNASREPRKRAKLSKGAQLKQGKATSKESVTKLVLRDAMKRFLISKVPPILTVHLKRFSQDARGRFSKLRGHVGFEEMLDVAPFIDPRCAEKNGSSTIYRLVGIVEHMGNMGSGHYVAYVRGDSLKRSADKSSSSSSQSSWFYASDAHVKSTTLSEVLQSEAYILFYERVDS